MSLNPMKLLQLKNSWQGFVNRHPKFPMFWKAVYKQALGEGTVIEFKVTTPDGKELAPNIRISQEDMQFLNQLKENA